MGHDKPIDGRISSINSTLWFHVFVDFFAFFHLPIKLKDFKLEETGKTKCKEIA